MVLTSPLVLAASPFSFKLLCTHFLCFCNRDYKNTLIWLGLCGNDAIWTMWRAVFERHYLQGCTEWQRHLDLSKVWNIHLLWKRGGQRERRWCWSLGCCSSCSSQVLLARGQICGVGTEHTSFVCQQKPQNRSDMEQQWLSFHLRCLVNKLA